MSDVLFRLPSDLWVQETLTTLTQTVDYGHALIGVPWAWSKSRGRGVRVAILDTGADESHPDLQGQVDDAKSFVGGTPRDGNGHGSHCAGIVAAIDNQQGVVGVAPECRLLIGKVLDDGGSGGDMGIANGIRWAIEQKADIISMSLGSSTPAPRIYDAILDAIRSNVLVIAAAGNEGPGEGTTGYPGSYKEVVSVGAIGATGKLTSFSSRGKVDVAAPGANILSLKPGGAYVKMSGTSMATPYVAGVAALVFGACKANSVATPTPAEFIGMLRGASVEAGSVGRDSGYGWGIVDPAFLIGERGPEPPAVTS